MLKCVCHFLLCGVLLALCAEAAAQSERDTVTDRVHALGDVDVSGRRTPPSARSGAPLQQLDRADLERMGVTEVSEAVRHFSGVSVKDYGGIGGMKTVSIRSLGAQHTGVEYDGVGISDCQSGQVDISRFSLDNVSLLTLTIGQPDSIFQTARMFASAGTLHIETLHPDFGERSSLWHARLRVGSFGMAAPSLLWQQRLWRGWGLSAYGSYVRADGNYPFKLQNGLKVIDSKRNNSDIESWRAEANLFGQLTARQTLQAKFYYFDQRRGLPGSVVYDNPYAAERLYDRNGFAQVRYVNELSAQWKLMASAKYNYSWSRDTDVQASGDTDDRYRQTEAYASATALFRACGWLSFSLANDFSYNYLSTTLDKCQYPRRYTLLTALAAHAQPWGQLTATASLLNTNITEHVRIGSAAPRRHRLSPAVSLAWRPLRQSTWRLRCSYQDIFRNPTFNDLYYLIIGNVNLKPETTRQVNVGTTWSGRLGRVADYVNVSLDAYYNKVDNKIVAVPTMFVWRMSNVSKVETLGLDANLAAECRLARGWKLSCMATYNFMQAEDVTDRSSVLWRNQIAYTPKHSGSASVTIENPWVNVSYNLTWAGKRYRLPQNLPQNVIKSYADHSVSLFRHFRFGGGQKLRVQADALNLGGKNYEIVRFYPMPGRNFKLTAALEF